MRTQYNLNHESIYLSTFPYGKTLLIVKVGRKRFYLDVEKNSETIFVERYEFVSSDRKSFSKHDREANAIMLSFKTEHAPIIDRKLLEGFPEIKKAVETMYNFGVGKKMSFYV